MFTSPIKKIKPIPIKHSRLPIMKLIIIFLLHLILLPLILIVFLYLFYIIISLLTYNFGLKLVQIWYILSLYFFPAAIIFLSLLVFILKNPIHSLVNLILLFLATALFLISIHVEFLAMIYLIIYIGAIAILFLFVIMMFNLRDLQQKIKKVKDEDFLFISLPIYLMLLLKFYKILTAAFLQHFEYDYYINKNFSINYFNLYGWREDHYKVFLQNLTEQPKDIHKFTLDLDNQFYPSFMPTQDIWIFSDTFYSYYSYLFILAGMLLLTSMLGAIVLALSTTEKSLLEK